MNAMLPGEPPGTIVLVENFRRGRKSDDVGMAALRLAGAGNYTNSNLITLKNHENA
jgi:hypothetical protein